MTVNPWQSAKWTQSCVCEWRSQWNISFWFPQSSLELTSHYAWKFLSLPLPQTEHTHASQYFMFWFSYNIGHKITNWEWQQTTKHTRKALH